jgi:hypothetical protein
VEALVVNRMFPSFGPFPAALLAISGGGGPDGTLGNLATNLADLNRVASREEQHVAVLAERLPGTPVIRVPFLADDVHDLGGLTEVGRWLFDATGD